MERAQLKPLPLNQYKVSTPTLGGFSLLQSVQNVLFFKFILLLLSLHLAASRRAETQPLFP